MHSHHHRGGPPLSRDSWLHANDFAQSASSDLQPSPKAINPVPGDILDAQHSQQHGDQRVPLEALFWKEPTLSLTNQMGTQVTTKAPARI